MALITNGDFSNGLTGWTVSQGGRTPPTLDATNQRVIFGRGNNDVQDGDRLEQVVALRAGQEYTLTFSMTELGNANAGFGLNIELIGGSNTQFLTSAQVSNDESKTITVTFTSNFDNPTLRIRGAFGFGGVNSSLILDNFALTCFARGTLIQTPNGPVAIERLRVGDLVDTLDAGPCLLRWIGMRHISPLELQARPDWRPVRISKDALGKGRPSRDLLVSPCHRVLLRGPRVDLLLGEPEGLIPAHAFVGLVDGVSRLDDPQDLPLGVSYFHLLFDDHQIIVSNGIDTESFHPTRRTVTTFAPEVCAELLLIYPELADPGATPRIVVRPLLKPIELRSLVGRSDPHAASKALFRDRPEVADALR